MKKFAFYKESGQTLLEIVILMGVVIAVVTGLTITVVNGLKNSQFSQNQSQATKLAQDGLERVRNIVNRNWMICVQGPVGYQSGDTLVTWNDVTTYNYTFGRRDLSSCRSTGCSFVLNPPTPPTTPANCSAIVTTAPGGVTSPNTTFWLTPSTIPEKFPGTPFTRFVYMEDDTVNTTTQKRITSEVKWTDSSGDHVSRLVTVVSLNKQ